MNLLPPQVSRIEVEDATQVHSARAEAMRVARLAGMPEDVVGVIALAATELAENLHRHAEGGELVVLPPRPGGDGLLWVTALDRGPGVEHFARCLTDGYTTSNTLGTGLGATQRLATEFDAASEPGRGTVVCAGFRRPGPQAHPSRPSFDVASFGLPISSETVSGDDAAAAQHGTVLQVMLADGLGHGPLAAQASAAAVATFGEYAQLPPAGLLARINEALVATRGAAVTVAGLNLEVALRGGTLQTAGLGNVSVLTAAPDGTTHRVATAHGTAGGRVGATPAQHSSDFPARGTLVLHSDGLATRWTMAERAGLLRHRAVVIAATLWRDHVRGSDDSLVLVAKAYRPSA